MLANPKTYFSQLSDPRRETKNKLHLLEDIIIISLCGAICGYDDWVSIEDFGNENIDWFKEILSIPNGIPSHDTFGSVMGRINKEAFALLFSEWMASADKGKHIAIDGKFIGGGFADKDAIHLVTAFASETRMVLAQHQVTDKQNEITALPNLLDMLNLKGSVISADAIYCQKGITEQLVKADADYVLSLKNNHKTLYEEVKLYLDSAFDKHALSLFETLDKGHGRLEQRKYALSDTIDWLEDKVLWHGLKSLGMVESTRIIGERTSVERRYYLTTLADTEQFAKTVRQHWFIENQQHWVLDVCFSEDDNRARQNNQRSNRALINRSALNLLRANDDSNLSIKRRRIRASMNVDYRMKILFPKQT